jgi:hypothetical protein
MKEGVGEVKWFFSIHRQHKRTALLGPAGLTLFSLSGVDFFARLGLNMKDWCAATSSPTNTQRISQGERNGDTCKNAGSPLDGGLTYGNFRLSGVEQSVQQTGEILRFADAPRQNG